MNTSKGSVTTDSQLPPSLFGGTPALLEPPVDNTNPIKARRAIKNFYTNQMLI